MIAVLAIAAILAPTPEFSSVLVLDRVGGGGRSPIVTDEVHSRLIDGTWKAPKAGDDWTLPQGQTRKWRSLQKNAEGEFRDRAFGGGYAYASFESAEEKPMVLEAAGHSMIYVNGEPRTGDVYSWGIASLPFLAKKGRNELLFQVSRGSLKFSVREPAAEVALQPQDPCLPDVLLTTDHPTTSLWGGVVVMNATNRPWTGLEIVSRLGDATTTSSVPMIAPMTVRDVPFSFSVPQGLEKGTAKLELELRKGEQSLGEQSFEIGVKGANEVYKRTFVSKIDGSVQYFAVQPAQPLPGQKVDALILSVHGASVEATNQANAYGPKRWANLVAATNRRPYGFDWEDWGRMDAFEVLAEAKRLFQPAEDRIYLTGHSMGGHGTWALGLMFPDQWAAIGPSAGWIHFWSYRVAGEEPSRSPMETMLRRSQNISDILQVKYNTQHYGIYALHGDADDNVPVEQMRMMIGELAPFHKDLQWFEKPGAGHWWDDDEEPGASCVEWPPMMDFFARHRRPESREVRDIDFSTVNPGVSATSRWATIYRQEKPLVVSRVQLRWENWTKHLSGKTENVASLVISPEDIVDGPVKVELDGDKIEAANLVSGHLHLEKADGHWRAANAPWPLEGKSPTRAGPFKEGWKHGVVLVYGTAGSPEEDRWNYARARYDAEQWWYRGNGAFEVLSDEQFAAANLNGDRDVVLYGNRDTNSCWNSLLPNREIDLGRGWLKIGERRFEGDDLAALFLQPRPGSTVASVMAVAGTGLEGMRATERLPYFTAGVQYPDLFAFRSSLYREGAEATIAVGFLGPDWTLEGADLVWNE